MSLNDILRLFVGVTNADLEALIAQEMRLGATFERLVAPPLPSLKFHYFIQFVNRQAEPQIIAGLGSDFNEKKAYRKAVFEYFERKMFFEVGGKHGFISTNGIAAHRYKSLAERAARFELNERDSFLRHWYSSCPFLKLEPTLDSRVAEIVQDLSAKGWSVLFRKTYLGLASTTLAFIVNDKTQGFALGLSSGRGEKFDSEKALMEAIVNLFFGHEGKSDGDLLKDLETDGVDSLVGHRTYWLLKHQIPSWILNEGLGDQTANKRGDAFHPAEIEKTESVFELSTNPIPVIAVKSANLLDLPIGVDLERNFEIMARNGLKLCPNPPLPHPIP